MTINLTSLHKIINYDELQNYVNLALSDKKSEVKQLLKKMSQPRVKDDLHVSFMGWKFDVTSTIYQNATASEVISGFEYLLERELDVDIYTKVLFMRSIYNILLPKLDSITKVDKDTIIDHFLEPEILELLRLFYWIDKCRKNLSDSFEIKFKEVKNALSIDPNSRKNIDIMISKSNQIALNIEIPYESRKKAIDYCYEQTGSLIRTLSSYLPELLLAAIVHENGFHVRFNRTSQNRSCDLKFDCYQTEVKTRIDNALYMKIERSLTKELEGTLKKLKVVDAVNEALRKKAEIAFLFLTFSSLGVGFGKFTNKRKNQFKIENALNLSICLAKRNQQEGTNAIPVVIFSTLIDVSDNKYKIFSFTFPYPIKKIDNILAADPENLVIDLNNLR